MIKTQQCDLFFSPTNQDEPPPLVDCPKSGNPQYCVIPGCRSKVGDITDDGVIVKLHRIPSQPGPRRTKFIRAIKKVRKDSSVITKSNTRICNLHFPGNVCDDEAIPDHFPTCNRPRTEVKCRRKITYHDKGQPTSSSTPGSSETTQTGQDDAVPTALTKYCDISVQTEPQYKDVGVQVGSTTVHQTAEASTQCDDVADITYEDLTDNDEKTRFYTGKGLPICNSGGGVYGVFFWS